MPHPDALASRRPFLDKLVSSAHMPRLPGQFGFYSTRSFPDLSHTAIQTQYCAPVIPASTPTNRMTVVFRNTAFLESLSFERPIAELRYKKEFFKRAHRVFTNKVLVELEEQRQERLQRRERIWTQGKKELGFANAFNYESGANKRGGATRLQAGEGGFESVEFDNNAYGDEFFESEASFGGLPVVLEGGPQQGDDEAVYLPDEYADDTQAERAQLLSRGVPAANPPSPPGLQSKAGGGGKGGRGLTVDTSLSSFEYGGGGGGGSTVGWGRSHSPLPAHIRLPDLLQESLSRASTAQQSSPSAKHSHTPHTGASRAGKGKPAPGSSSTPSRRRRAFNRMTFFECLLDTVPVPDPHAPRYGQLPSPIRVARARSTVAPPTQGSSGARASLATAASMQRPTASANQSQSQSQSQMLSPVNVQRVGTASPSHRAQPQVQALPPTQGLPRAGTASSRSPSPSPSGSSAVLGDAAFASFFDSTASGPDLGLQTEVVLPPEDPDGPVADLAELEITNTGLEKWTLESVTRCLTGDKPRPPKDYR